MRWRLLHGPSADGARQMALDEALFQSALESGPVATVRLYRFLRPTVSFGYGQRLADVCRPEVCEQLGVDRVRRPTGGRALLHQHELTYAVTAPSRDAFAGLSVHELYETVRSTLARGLVRLGVPLDPMPPPSPGRRAAGRAASPIPCLASPERHEITSGGRKLVASAQRRRREGFLQHGSILLRVDAELWERIRPRSDEIPLAAVGLDELLRDTPADTTRLEAALASAFEDFFGEAPLGRELTPCERAVADALEAKYRSEAWNVGARAPTVDNSQAAW